MTMGKKIKYNWQFIKHGSIIVYSEIEGRHGLSFPPQPEVYGEYTTYLDPETNMKRHLLFNINIQGIKTHLKRNGEMGERQHEYPYEHIMISTKYICEINIRDKFMHRLNEKEIIDEEWFLKEGW